MYAMYQTGASLADIGIRYGRSRQAVYDVFRTRGYELRSKKMVGLQILDGIKFTRTKGGYLRGTCSDGRRMLMHHYVYEKHTGQRVMPGWNIHHKDGNKENNLIENLEYMTIADHSRIYSPHLNQFTSPTGSRIVRRNKWGGEHRYQKGSRPLKQKLPASRSDRATLSSLYTP